MLAYVFHQATCECVSVFVDCETIVVIEIVRITNCLIRPWKQYGRRNLRIIKFKRNSQPVFFAEKLVLPELWECQICELIWSNGLIHNCSVSKHQTFDRCSSVFGNFRQNTPWCRIVRPHEVYGNNKYYNNQHYKDFPGFCSC